jgi:hypothetical protein
MVLDEVDFNSLGGTQSMYPFCCLSPSCDNNIGVGDISIRDGAPSAENSMI